MATNEMHPATKAVIDYATRYYWGGFTVGCSITLLAVTIVEVFFRNKP